MDAEQAEEREVLQSIYEGDFNFTQVEDRLFQYKYEEAGEGKNFVLEVRWGEKYPEEAPFINMDVFYNKHICPSVKERIVKAVREQAESMLGMSMTFSLFEWLKDNHAALLEGQDLYFQDLKSGIAAKDATADLDKLALDSNPEKNSKKKDSGMTKNQKRRMWDRQNAAGERDRGWNWIDVVKHLSQSGSAGTS
ncbi:RWD domain-containing protein 4 [Hyalella azteca]|uniref:RWD domain-containing protein 4 n=1 Tax=Hyalella azteca TaxID=294128 RepID=A0A8B7PPX7_HYAAZ|nr:RWD domain-containing protein 4 [Hyalella azteca]